MSARIRILPEQLTNKIAAGEVVERPASVIKELVENGLDAAATDIIVEIEDGGKRLIKVSDNGCGMSREELLLSLERHATSKIATDADLFALQTLGFRGEALPSIASVSRLSLSSRLKGGVEGSEVYVEGGRVRDVKSCGMTEGTAVAVRNLFFNTPARLKFMKTRETETGHIGELITRLALSRPEVRFTFIAEGNVVFKLLPGDLASRARELLGKTVSEELYPLAAESGGIILKGLIGSPAISRSTSGSLYTFINGRYIRDKVVQHAIMQACKNVLEKGRYPVVIIFIEISPEEVDVNVHPTKHEVRFREQGKVHGAIQGSIEALLGSTPWIRSAAPLFVPYVGHQSPTTSGARVAEVKDALLRYAVQERLPSNPHTYLSVQEPDLTVTPSQESESLAAGSTETDSSGARFAQLQIIGQFRGAYLLCQDGDELVLIDQHAAHERVVFDELRAALQAGSVEGQGLLFPETLELGPAEAAVISEQGELLHRLAFELEHFGGNTWLLKTVPRLLAGLSYQEVLRDLLEDFASIGSSSAIADKLDDILATIACHSVVRGHHVLSAQEIRTLLERLEFADHAATCPHGRPLVARLSLLQIEKMFKRA
jgi:DNA mismatch repair protein MutL